MPSGATTISNGCKPVNKQHILLCYAPGFAGNLVAEIIAVNPDFKQREQQTGYTGDWKRHAMDGINNFNLVFFPGKRNIILGHVEELYNLAEGLNWDWSDIQLVNVEHDGCDFFTQRYEKMYSEVSQAHTTLDELTNANPQSLMYAAHKQFYFYYNSDVVQRVFNSPSVFTLTTTDIYEFERLYDFIVNTLEITIDKSSAKAIHTDWLEKNQKWLSS